MRYASAGSVTALPVSSAQIDLVESFDVLAQLSGEAGGYITLNYVGSP